MAGGACGARDLRVADVPHEHVPEAVLVLALHRARARRADELLAGELVQRQLHLGRVAPAHLGRARPPRRPCPAPRRPGAGSCAPGVRVSRRAAISACTESGTSPLSPSSAAVREQAHELLRVQGVSARALEQRLLRLRRQHRPLEQRATAGAPSPRRVSGARLIRCAFLASAPKRRVPLVQLRAGRAEDEQRHAFRPVGEVLEEGRGAQRRPSAGPRRRAPSRAREASDSRKRRQAVNDSSCEAGSAPTPTSGARRALSQARSGSSAGSARSSFASASSGESDSRIPHSAFTISPSAQKAIPSP